MKTIMVQDILENKIAVSDAQNMVIIHKGEEYSYFDEGTSRYVFTNPDKTKVIKLLKTVGGHGHDFNTSEAQIYNNASDVDKEQMVRTELINGLIEQDFVMPIKYAGRKLTIPQLTFAASCRNEVGWAGDKLVCFDLDEFKKY